MARESLSHPTSHVLTRWWPAVLASLGFTLCCTTGCAGPAKHLAKEAAPPAAVRTLQTMNQPDGRQAMQDLIASIADGSVAVLSDEQRQARIAQLSGKLGTQVGGAVARQLQTELPKAIHSATGAAVDAALSQAASDPGRERSEKLVATLSHAAVGAAIQELQAELGPALRDSITGPDGGSSVLQQTAGSLSREVSRQMVLGVHEGLTDVQHNYPEGTGLRGLFETESMSLVVILVAVGLALAVVALAVWVAVVKRRDRRHQRELQDREGVLLLVAQALRSSRDEAWVRQVRSALLQATRDRGEARYVRSLLADDLGDRVSSPTH